MKEIDKIIADLEAWVDEDRENRAIALVTVQKKEDKKKSYVSEEQNITHGITAFLINAFQDALNDKDPENGVATALKHAILREGMKRMHL